MLVTTPQPRLLVTLRALLINAGVGCRAERRGFHSACHGSDQLIGKTHQLHEGEYLQQSQSNLSRVKKKKKIFLLRS